MEIYSKDIMLMESQMEKVNMSGLMDPALRVIL